MIMWRNGPTRRARVLPFLGVAGSLIVTTVAVIVALGYTGKHGEPFSVLNHFISELGQRGVSRYASLFNAGLFFAGALFIPFCIGLGMRLASWGGWIATAAGALAGGFCAAVGVFPMNALAVHTFVAMWFFRLGLATTFLFGLAIIAQRQTRVSRWASLLSLIAVGAFAGFLILAPRMGVNGSGPLHPSFFENRPRIWTLALAEWAVFAATILWFLGVGLLVIFRDRRSATPSGTEPVRR